MKTPIPVLQPHLSPGETVLISVERLAVTVVDGKDGWLMFRQWEVVSPPPAGPVLLLGLVWKVTDEFVLGSMGREALRSLLNARVLGGVPAPAHVVDPLLCAPDTLWYGFVIAEAATTFKNGGTSMESDAMATPEEAKAWVLFWLEGLLDQEEQISQALVIGPGGKGFDLDPSTWGSDEPRWIDIEVDDPQAGR